MGFVRGRALGSHPRCGVGHSYDPVRRPWYQRAVVPDNRGTSLLFSNPYLDAAGAGKVGAA